MSNLRRAWVVGASVVILAVGFAAAASPRRAQDLAAMRDARHAAASSRPAGEAPVVAPIPEAPRPAPAAPARLRARPRPRAQAAAPAGVTAVLTDPPAPEPLPMTWEDLFPPQPAASGPSGWKPPCFDQLQGIAGISPCPGVTVSGMK